MVYKVKKGLEKPLKIQGMLQKHFYIWVVTGGVGVFILIGKIMQVSSVGSATSFGSLIITGLIVGAVFLGMKFYFVKKAKVRKMNFGKTKTVITNIDIMKALK